MGFIIETDSLRYLENIETGEHSYNFPILRDSKLTDNLENLVLYSNSEGGYDVFLVEYGFNITQNHTIDEVILNASTTKYTPIDFDISTLYDNVFSKSLPEFACVQVWVLTAIPNHQGQLIPEGPLYVSGWVLESSDCAWIGGGVGGGGSSGGSDPGDGSGTSGGNSPGGGSLSSGSGSLASTPAIPSDVQGNSSAANFLITAFGGESEITRRQFDWITNQDNSTEVSLLLNFVSENGMTSKTKAFALELVDLLSEEDTTDFKALNFTLEAYTQNIMHSDFNLTFLKSVNQYTSIDFSQQTSVIDPVQMYFILKVATLKALHPDWSDAKIYWEAVKELVHITLDGLGMIPALGIIPDLVNGVIYTIEGDGVNATFSFAAAIPVAGWLSTTGKYTIKIVNQTTDGLIALVFKVGDDGLINFGNRNILKNIIGSAGTGLHAHHIIPWDFRNHALVQKAANSTGGFNMNEAINGIPLPTGSHLVGHSSYNSKVNEILDNIYDDTMDNDEAYTVLSNFINYLDDLISSNQSLNLGEISLLINYP